MDFHPVFQPYKIRRKICVYFFVILSAVSVFCIVLKLWWLKDCVPPPAVFCADCSSHSLLGYESVNVQVLVVADSTMSDHHGRDLQKYLNIVLQHTAAQYKDASLGETVILQAAHFISLDENATNILEQQAQLFSVPANTNSTSIPVGLAADVLLANFCKWQSTLKIRTELEYDTAVYLTRKKLFLVQAKNSSLPFTGQLLEIVSAVFGVATGIGGICRHLRNCAVIQDFELETASTVAHEIGHLLGMFNDGSDSCQQFPMNNSFEEGHFIMGTDKQFFHIFGSKWSTCSKVSLDLFLRTNESLCIRINPEENQVEENPATEAERFPDFTDLDGLCGYFLYPYEQQSISVQASQCPGNSECSPVSCLQGPDQGCVTFLNLQWPEGTDCGNKTDDVRSNPADA